MVPAAQAVSMAPSSRTIRVVARAETGQGATAPAESGVLTFTSGAFEPADWARVTDAMFRDALTSTLAQSGLFKSVGVNGDEEYELDRTIYTQQLALTGYELTATIGIRYKLVATGSNREIWGDSIVSQGATGGRQSDANEIAMRNNLQQLVDRLASLSFE